MMDWKRMLGIRKKEIPIIEPATKKVVVKGDRMNMICKPGRAYLDENGEVKIPEKAFAIERQEETITIREKGETVTTGVRVYYSYLLPVSEEEEKPEKEEREEDRPVVITRKR
jgi:hypothetical protein